MRTALVAVACLAAACTRPADERTASELEVGQAHIDGASVVVVDGLAHVRRLAPGELDLWAQAPAFVVHLELDAAATWTVVDDNAMPDAVVVGDDAAEGTTGARPTRRSFELTLAAGPHHLVVGPPDADATTPFRFAAMGDIQDAMGDVDAVFRRIGQEPGVRFVVSMGDIAQEAKGAEYDVFESKLAALPVPYFTTIGNHDLWEGVTPFRQRFGRANVHFDFHGVAFTLADSGSAGLDPLVYDWLDDWLADARDRPHVFATHFPPIDPIGIRSGSFRSRAEAFKLLSRLQGGKVDLTLYGHIHTYLAFDNAGIPAYISGGGGAKPERWDGIGRHFLAIDAVPAEGRLGGVALVRVD
jgi:3',5'-cyclic AMP phosphodiesterase CpdA